jgi:hypothetical protein
MFKRSLTALGAGLVLAALTPVAPSQAAANPIAISQCYVTAPKPMSKKASGTQIVYMNMGSRVATHIVFLVSYRNAESHFTRRQIDDGMFAPHAPISHHFSLYSDVTYAGKTASCQAIAVTWANGTMWKM